MRHLFRTSGAVLVALAMVAGFFSPASAAEAPPPLFVSEIAADHPGVDNFEYFELTNTTDQDIPLTGIGVAYTYVDSADTDRDVPLTVTTLEDAPATVPAGASVVVWLQYAGGNVNSFEHTEADFRAQWGDAASTYTVLKATGQNGMANGGDRGIRLTAPGGEAIWSHYPAGSVSTTTTAHFRATTATASQPHVAELSAPSPGALDPIQLADEAPAPETNDLPIFISEIAPDHPGSDEFEFFEITNVSDGAVDVADYDFTYTFADTHEGGNPLTVDDATLAPGETAVVWLQYTANNIDSFVRTDEDFRTQWGDVTSTYALLKATGQSGMANGGNRGIRITDAAGAMNWSFYPTGSVSSTTTAHFAHTGEARSQGLVGELSAPSPGAVDPVQIGAEAPVEPVEPADPADAPDVFVSEIGPDNVSHDEFEFFEITNASDSDIDLTDYQLAYIYADTDDVARDVPLTLELADDETSVVVPAGGAVALWLKYVSPNIDSFARTDADFRAMWGAADDEYPIVGVTGQSGMANGGDRGVRITAPDGSMTWSYSPPGSVSPTTTVHFRHTAHSPSQDLVESMSAPTPGRVDDAQLDTALVPPVVEPEPTPEPEPVPDPDPTLETAALQITEVLPDTSNVGGADAYEFIEVYNATDRPVDFGDYKINYLYPAADLSVPTSTRWPSQPEAPVIEPGRTLVLWIKNSANQHLTYTDFNTKWGTALEGDVELVEIHSGGMANAGLRGVDVITNTGVTISRVYYNVTGDDTLPDQGIHYAVGDEDPALSEILEIAPATPGIVGVGTQVPDGLMVVTDDTVAPTIVDVTAAEAQPGADFGIHHRIADDRIVRTATLELRNDVDGGTDTHNLDRSPDGTYTWTVPAADLTGKRWYEYRVTASDGTNPVATDWVRVPVAGANTDPVRIHHDDMVAGTAPIVVGTETDGTDATLSIDGRDVTSQLVPALEGKPVFVFEATGVNDYFRNGVLVGDEIVGIFERFTPDWTTLSFPVDEDHLTLGEDFTISVWAGTKAAPEIDLDENNDDFEIRNLRLVLPDGRTLRHADFVDAGTILRMGDSVGKLDYYDAVFDVPADAFGALRHDWDTTVVADGPHEIVATNGDASATSTIVVDNTAPSIALTPPDGLAQKGAFALDADVADAGSGVATVEAWLGSERIALPYETSSVELDAGDHTFRVVATDALGNSAIETSVFITAAEQPGIEILSPADGAAITAGDELTARVTDPTDDPQTGSFNLGWHLDAADGDVSVTGGATSDALATAREGAATPLGEAVTSATLLPYQVFTVDVPADAGDDYRARITWDGEINDGQRVSMSVLTTDGTWHRVAETIADAPGVTLEALVRAEGHAVDGEMTVLVQHTDGWAQGNLSDRDSALPPFHPEAEPRGGYDFTVAHISDTQYYNSNPDWHHHQLGISEFLVEQAEHLNLQYVHHTGDIVDNNRIPGQMERADAAYRLLDDAGIPYGVLAGNHDVSGWDVDYSDYSEFFGDARFAGTPWFAASHLDNRGHVDLVSAGGIDFLYLYMGWGAEDEQIAWMNDVLAQYPERIAVINLHEYMLTTGGLGLLPQRMFDEVIAHNPNVRMVQSGHYHDAYTRIDTFDDDRDGTDERTVYSMLFDYQGLPEGGQGYIRLHHFDNEGERMMVRTYSPSLEDFDADDATLEPEHQSFEIAYADLGIEPKVKSLVTHGFTVDVLSERSLGAFDDVASGSVVTADWPEDLLGAHGFYVVTRDAYGGEAISEIRSITVVEGEPGEEPTEPGEEPTGPGEEPSDPGEEPTEPGAGDDGTDDDRPRPGLPPTGV